MTGDRGLSAPALLVIVVLVLAFVVALLEHGSRAAARDFATTGELRESLQPLAGVIATYLKARAHVFRHWFYYAPVAVILPGLLFHTVRYTSSSMSRWREGLAGMAFKKRSYKLPHPFARRRRVAQTRSEFARAVAANPAPERQVVLGLSKDAAPIYLSDRARSMHTHVVGQTGSGKTQGAIYPLLFQDICRDRSVLFIDAKGSWENEEMLVDLAAAAGRSDEVRIFTLNSKRPCHTYNPLYLPPGADPRAVAERVFSTFADNMDEPFYRDTALEFFRALVCVLAGMGKQMNLRDVLACLSDDEVFFHALRESSDRVYVRRLRTAREHLGTKYYQSLSGLRVAVSKYDHPALNSYTPDIILENLLAHRGIVGFSLPANAYKFQARAVGMVVLQHLQQLGAARQLDRSLSQEPLYVYADEFYTFAYEGFIDAVNKLRDAHISLLLAHQSLSDLERISPEYARGIWDNTRNKLVLYQNDAELCERLAASLGTHKDVQLTVRRNADSWLNQQSMLEASSREVDSYILHPSLLKNLDLGQAYLVQAGIGEGGNPSTAHGVNLAMLGDLPKGTLPMPAVPNTDAGLNLERLC